MVMVKQREKTFTLIIYRRSDYLMSQITRETKNGLMNYRRLVRVLQVVRILLMKVVYRVSKKVS